MKNGNPIALFSLDYMDLGGVETQLISIIRNGVRDYGPIIFIGKGSEKFEQRILDTGGIFIGLNSNFVSTISRLSSIIKRNNICLLHIHGWTGSFVGRIVGWYCKIPTVITIHLSLVDLLGESKGIFSKTKLLIALIVDVIMNYLLTDKVIFVSQRSMERSILSRLTPASKCIFNSNGVDLEEFVNFQTKMQKNGPMIFKFVGRLHHQKGVDILFQSVAWVQSNDFELHLIGDGPEINKLQALSQRLNIQNKVFFLGERNNIPELLSNSDVFILPSRFEAMPYALIEAMAVGLPSIVTDVGDNAFMLDNGQCGIVVPPEDPNALAEAIERLIREPDVRRNMGENSRKRSMQFSEKDSMEKLFKVYESCLKKSGTLSIE